MEFSVIAIAACAFASISSSQVVLAIEEDAEYDTSTSSTSGDDLNPSYYFVIVLFFIIKILFWTLWCHYRCRRSTRGTIYVQQATTGWRGIGSTVMPVRTIAVIDQQSGAGHGHGHAFETQRRSSKDILTENAEGMAVDIPPSEIQMRSANSTTGTTTNSAAQRF